jgi:hypothetical protein
VSVCLCVSVCVSVSVCFVSAFCFVVFFSFIVLYYCFSLFSQTVDFACVYANPKTDSSWKTASPKIQTDGIHVGGEKRK